MRKIRVGKTITCTMTITTDGEAVSLEGESLAVDFVCEGRLHHWAEDVSVSGNTVTAVFEGSQQKLPRPGYSGSLGRYTVTVYKNHGDSAQTLVDFVTPFFLVPFTQDEESDESDSLATETIDLGEGDFGFAGHVISIVDGYWYVDGVNTGYATTVALTCDDSGNLYADGEIISTAIPDAIATLQSSVDTAVSNAETATEAANEATEAANEATKAANEAAAAATEAAAEVMGTYYPTDMSLTYPATITLTNVVPNYIVATLTPSTALENVVFHWWGDSLRVRPDGQIVPLEAGTTEVDVIPTMNTALYQTITIEIVESSTLTTEDDEVLLTEDGYEILT